MVFRQDIYLILLLTRQITLPFNDDNFPYFLVELANYACNFIGHLIRSLSPMKMH